MQGTFIKSMVLYNISQEIGRYQKGVNILVHSDILLLTTILRIIYL